MARVDKAYALKDNPFSLEASLPVDIPNDIRDLLATAPLQIAKEERLLPYYCDKIYPLKKSGNWTPFQAFQQIMRDRGYNNNPKTLDPQGHSRIVLIRGPVGTGKTTLAHRMMSWLIECHPGPDKWKPVSWSPESKNDNALKQSKSITTKFKNDVLASGNGRFLCLLEDVLIGADTDVLQVFLDLFPGRTLFFFITAYDEAIRAKTYNSFNPGVTVYDTTTLTPEQAVSYCNHRIPPLRTERHPEWLNAYPIFPFTDDIVQRSLSEKAQALWGTPGPVALRQLNVLFSRILDETRLGLTSAFDIADIPAAEAINYLVDPTRPSAE